MDHNKSYLEKISPEYEKSTKSGDDFAQHVLDAEYNFSFLNRIKPQTPSVSLTTKKNLNYVQNYCKNVLAGPNFYTKRKNLKSYMLILTLSGQGELVYQNKAYTMNAGDCCFINCENEHYYHTLS